MYIDAKKYWTQNPTLFYAITDSKHKAANVRASHSEFGTGSADSK